MPTTVLNLSHRLFHLILMTTYKASIIISPITHTRKRRSIRELNFPVGGQMSLWPGGEDRLDPKSISLKPCVWNSSIKTSVSLLYYITAYINPYAYNRYKQISSLQVNSIYRIFKLHHLSGELRFPGLNEKLDQARFFRLKPELRPSWRESPSLFLIPTCSLRAEEAHRPNQAPSLCKSRSQHQEMIPKPPAGESAPAPAAQQREGFSTSSVQQGATGELRTHLTAN